ncbi:lipopolysaccharide assembly protein LapA domain-containing protein [Sulfobacillus thermosulfidooxidans]|uniref:lipopolysaccharide assembly protein LapA domain-containing protein n=1 Tax=Sulfobacillus thermosulfidooxidans TaxID=28034 RepID=UPI000AEC13D8|nr:lipopolysaccharide assembly protein LapA domain-containing protein [Sulfobacillus thermosulfidooxidans]
MVNPESRGLRKVIVWLFGAVIIAILALQNQHPVSLHVFFWQLPHISLALVVLLSLLLGASIGAGGMLWDRYKSQNRMKHVAPTPPEDDPSSMLSSSPIDGMPDDSPVSPPDTTSQ